MEDYEKGTLGYQLEFDYYSGSPVNVYLDINPREIDNLEYHILAGNCLSDEEPRPGEVLRSLGFYDETDKRSCIQQKGR